MFLIIKPSTVLLTCFIVLKIRFCFGEKVHWKELKGNSKNYISIRNVMQEDVIDLNSMKPEDLLVLKSNILQEVKDHPEDIIRGRHKSDLSLFQNLTTDYVKLFRNGYSTRSRNPRDEKVANSISNTNFREFPGLHSESVLPRKELTKSNTKQLKRLGNDLVNSRNTHGENIGNSVFKATLLRDVPETHVMSSKNMKRHSQRSKYNQSPYLKNVSKTIQGEYLKEETDKRNYGLLQNDPEKSFVHKNIDGSNKKFSNLRYGFSDFKRPKLELLQGDEEDEKETLKSGKSLPRSINHDYNHRMPLEIGKGFSQIKRTNNSFPKPITNTAEVPSKRDIASKNSSQPLKSDHSLIPSPYTKSSDQSSENTYIISSKREDQGDKNSNLLISGVSAGHEKHFSTNYTNGTRKSEGENDKNEVIRLDLSKDFLHKSANLSGKEHRHKKDVQRPYMKENRIELWKTVDVVLTGFAGLTVFVLGTLCMFVRSRRKPTLQRYDDGPRFGGRLKKKFVSAFVLVRLYLMTCLNLTEEELEDPEDHKPKLKTKRSVSFPKSSLRKKDHAHLKTSKSDFGFRFTAEKQPSREPVTNNSFPFHAKNVRVSFESNLTSSSRPTNKTISTVPTTTTGSHSLIQTTYMLKTDGSGRGGSGCFSSRLPSLSTILSDSSNSHSPMTNDFKNPSSFKKLPSLPTVPSDSSCSPFYHPLRTTDFKSPLPCRKLPSLPTVSSDSSSVSHPPRTTVFKSPFSSRKLPSLPTIPSDSSCSPLSHPPRTTDFRSPSFSRKLPSLRTVLSDSSSVPLLNPPKTNNFRGPLSNGIPSLPTVVDSPPDALQNPSVSGNSLNTDNRRTSHNVSRNPPVSTDPPNPSDNRKKKNRCVPKVAE